VKEKRSLKCPIPGVVKAQSGLRFRSYDIISDAISRGVQFGVTRSFKHTDSPTKDHIAETVERAVMGQLSEVLDWGND
jgi:hypothetical protein